MSARKRRIFDRPVTEDVDKELRFHIDMRTDELIAEGWDAVAARAEAVRLFGNVNALGEECRGLEQRHRESRRRARLFEAIRQDARFGARMLVKAPLFTAVAVLTLALGIGANTAIFSVVNGVLLRPLPYPEPEELVLLWEVTERGQTNHVSTPNLRDWREQARTFEGVAAHPSARFWSRETVLGGTEAAHVRVASVTQDFFPVLAVPAALGRGLAADDHRLGGAPAAVVSQGFWQRWLGGDSDLSRHVLRMGDMAYPVVGVMPSGFDYPSGSDVWVAAERLEDSSGRTAHNWVVIARLREGVTLDAAQREMAAISARLKEEYGTETDAKSVLVMPLRDELVGALQRPLFLLLGAAALVLLIACTNLASGLLARGASRQAEVAIRASLGASRPRIVGQMLTEALLMSLAGALAGLALGWVVVRSLAALAPAGVPRIDEVRLDAQALLFTLAVSFATAILFGLYPALRASAVAVGDALRGVGRGNTGDSRSGWWGALISVEVCLALLLLVGSALLMRSFWRVISIDPGFHSSGVLTADLSLPDAKYPNDARVADFYLRLMAEVERLPGVESVGLINHLPLSGFSINGSFEMEGRGETEGYADYRIASGQYFDAMGIPLLEGRTFEPSDDAGTPDVAVINQTAARRFWPGESPMGARIRNLANDKHRYGDRWLTVVGVVGDVRHGGLTTGARPEIYVHYQQRPARAISAVLAIRASVPPANLAAAVRAALERIDREVPAELSVMDSRIASTVSERRFTMTVLGAFAAIALLLASLGIYGVVSYAVARRTREIGIRLALGVEPRRVRWLMQRRVLILVGVGAVMGVIGALAVTSVLGRLLYEVSPTDPLTFAGVLALLLGVAWLASYLPARRTTRVDPMIVLRTE